MDKNEDRTIKNKVREKIQGVSMLPFGLIAGFAGEKEIRIIEIAGKWILSSAQQKK